MKKGTYCRKFNNGNYEYGFLRDHYNTLFYRPFPGYLWLGEYVGSSYDPKGIASNYEEAKKNISVLENVQ